VQTEETHIGKERRKYGESVRQQYKSMVLIRATSHLERWD
jgi:hypothetical protein